MALPFSSKRVGPPAIAVLLALLLTAGARAGAPRELRLDVNGVERTAVVYPGRIADTQPSPVVLFFHGFGDTARNLAAATRLHERWPEATVVYPQGLADHGDGRGRTATGWQYRPGIRGDRDLAFVDALLARLTTEVSVDPDRIHAVGYSNGGFFVFTLLAARAETFAAFAAVASYAADDCLDAADTPRPVLYIFGRTDTAFDADPECGTLEGGGLACAHRTRDALHRLNRATGRARALRRGAEAALHEPDGAPTVWALHPGGHVWPTFAPETIVEFFRTRRRGEAGEDFVDATHFAAVVLDEPCAEGEGKMAYAENRHATRPLRIKVQRTDPRDRTSTRLVNVAPQSRKRLGCTAKDGAAGEAMAWDWAIVEASFR